MAVPEGVELGQLGELAGVPEGILEWANAELRDGVTPAVGDREGYLIKVPNRYYERIGAVLSPDSRGGAAVAKLHPYVQVPSAH